MLKHIKQPIASSTCGQHCVAIAAGVEVEDVVKFLGSKGGTGTKQILKAFRHYGIESLSERLTRNTNGLPDYCLVKMRFKKLTPEGEFDPKGKWTNYSHWILRWDGVFYDPGQEEAGNIAWWGFLASYVELVPKETSA